MMLTILTPTYNRSNKLINLKNSLERQDSNDFEWIIVDDGSSDGTNNVVKDFTLNSKIKIKYFYKENGGKHTALNYGVKLASGDLIFIVDSDDVLTNDAVSTILKVYNRYKNYKNICGYTFLRRFPDGKVNGNKFKKDYLIDNYINTRINSGDIYSDKAEVFYTAILKKYPFPEFKGEKFLGEDIVWIRLARKYNMVHINKAIYVGEYLNDGLTKNRRIQNINSPNGCMCRAKEFMHNDIAIKFRIKGSIQYIVYGLFSGRSICDLQKESNSKILTIFAVIPSYIIYKIWYKKYIYKDKREEI